MKKYLIKQNHPTLLRVSLLRQKGGFSYLEVIISAALISVIIIPITLSVFHIYHSQSVSYKRYNSGIMANNLLAHGINALINGEHSPEAYNDLFHLLGMAEEEFNIRYKTHMFTYRLTIYTYPFGEANRVSFYSNLEEGSQPFSIQGSINPTVGPLLRHYIYGDTTLNLTTYNNINLELVNSGANSFVNIIHNRGLEPDNIHIYFPGDTGGLFVITAPQKEITSLRVFAYVFDEEENLMVRVFRDVTMY